MKERIAIEALRAGVPNRSAIRLLGTHEQTLEEDFRARLSQCGRGLLGGKGVSGMVIAGAFGAGKSHLLGYMRELALHDNFVVSLLPISKETPLSDPSKVFAAAVRHAEVRDCNDDLMTAVMERLKPGSDAYDGLEHWASDARPGLSPLFAALLHLIPKKQVPLEDLGRIARFFGGAKLGMNQVRPLLRSTGSLKLFDLRPVKAAELALQRLRFAPQLFYAAGYSGWCVLLDEVELVGRYGPMQRGKSYAELVRWLGLADRLGVPGILGVAAISSSFASVMIDRRRDDEVVPQLLEDKGLPELAAFARSGLNALQTPTGTLLAPDKATLASSLNKLRGLYRAAYDWEAPDGQIGEQASSKPMRQYIKSWITAWDLDRLYKERGPIVIEDLPPNYDENLELERGTEGADEEE